MIWAAGTGLWDETLPALLLSLQMCNIQIGLSATLLSRGVSLTANILGTEIMEQFIGILHYHLLILILFQIYMSVVLLGNSNGGILMYVLTTLYHIIK